MGSFWFPKELATLLLKVDAIPVLLVGKPLYSTMLIPLPRHEPHEPRLLAARPTGTAGNVYLTHDWKTGIVLRSG